MRSYQIYWIGDEFAHYFYGREQNFFQLFFESSMNGNGEKSVIEKQIQYITEKFSLRSIASVLNEALAGRESFSSENNHLYTIELPKQKGKAILSAEEKCLYLKASGSYEVETVFFHSLKKLNACLFAVDFERKNYGWLEPIKKEILFK
ncbi:sporulation inhibitor of replication protein SirA [Bacillus aerolatus]|uniref:Sporulation inhibitor of replication protein SirA n=1 Tax=Bacillus aerolatus TaxID=2653354 RepID=A0A6I1FYI9_9BACI|nr:sporulation inhibitor of replication protein SirA [Bacillus aerolatus]KAB7708188.1 sporulation inhibitor of replication protein SirA [Bacillus aerolatus]